MEVLRAFPDNGEGRPSVIAVHQGETPPAVISIQPIPVEFSLIVTPDRRWSSLVRRWSPGESSRCRLCPHGECVARLDTCHLMIEKEISLAEAATYSTAVEFRRPHPLAASSGSAISHGRP